jgi:hypothetical protein
MSKRIDNNNENLLQPSFFEDALSFFYDAKEKNEELYDQLFKQYNDNQSVGFSLGASRSSIELAKVLSTLRSNSIQAASQLFNAKKSLVELEIKKTQQKIDKTSEDNNKDFIRTTLAAIQIDNVRKNEKQLEYKPAERSDINRLNEIIEERTKEGSIKFTHNEKAMAKDFKDEAEPVLDRDSGQVKVVIKGTNEEIPNYPLERIKMGKIINIDEKNNIAFCEGGKSMRVENVI